MCGIIGYCGNEAAIPRLVDGLKALEYRGYDSAGISVFAPGGILTVKSAGRIANIEKKLCSFSNVRARCGIGHTRWATHGKPDDVNAHPHCVGRVCLVHNGMIENYAALRDSYQRRGYQFVSETDSEVIAAVLDEAYSQSHDARQAIRHAAGLLRGSFACGIVFSDQQDVIYAVRRDSPLIVAETENGNYIASDICAVPQGTEQYYALADEEIAVVTCTKTDIYDENDRPVAGMKIAALRDWSERDRGGFPHYMLKEIFDTPDAIRQTCRAYLSDEMPDFGDSGFASILPNVRRIFITACGTALNAGKMGKFFFERLAGIPTHFEVASEFRYYPPLTEPGDMALFITQSGETADTLAALRLCKKIGLKTVALVNVPNSGAAREADCTLYTRAGAEVAVASTKAYAAQTALLYQMAVFAAGQRGLMSVAQVKDCMRELTQGVPAAVDRVLEQSDKIKKLSAAYGCGKNCFFIGRGQDFYLAEESALKLKEVSYTHCEAYAAGELKHGTIALIEADTSVVAIASGNITRDKTIGNIREVKARGAKVLLVTDRDSRENADCCNHIYEIADVRPELFPLCAAVFFQLFAYHAAVLRGRDVDKPRNLAKSVTVE